MSRVFIVQDQLSRDQRTGETRRRFPQVDTLQPLGDIVYVIDQRVNSFDTAKAQEDIRDRLEDITEDDYIVLIGTTLLCSLALAYASHMLDGNVRILQWSTRESKYLEMNLRTF